MITTVYERLAQARTEESAFTTAELLGNAALGILALAAIWGGLSAIGVNVVNVIADKLGVPHPT